MAEPEYLEKNPLAELAEEAEELKRVLEDLKFDRRVVVCDKLQRIVAELAKAQVTDSMARRVRARANCLEYSFGNEPLKTVGIFTTEHFPKWICSALNVVEKCRAVAEEKVNNDK